MNWIAKIVGINVVLWVFVFLCVVSVWCFANAGVSAQGMRPLVVCIGLLAALLSAAIVIVPFWVILKRAGAHPALSILMLVPLLNLVTLYWVAFSKLKFGGVQEP